MLDVACRLHWLHRRYRQAMIQRAAAATPRRPCIWQDIQKVCPYSLVIRRWRRRWPRPSSTASSTKCLQRLFLSYYQRSEATLVADNKLTQRDAVDLPASSADRRGHRVTGQEDELALMGSEVALVIRTLGH